MTLVLSMPALGNVGGLLALITFIYSVLGVQVMGARVGSDGVVMGTRGLGWSPLMTSDDLG